MQLADEPEHRFAREEDLGLFKKSTCDSRDRLTASRRAPVATRTEEGPQMLLEMVPLRAVH